MGLLMMMKNALGGSGWGRDGKMIKGIQAKLHWNFFCFLPLTYAC